MAVNTMGIEQAYTLIAAIHNQVTGKTAIAPTDTSSFISVAQATLQNGYEPVLGAISQVIGRTLVAVRPYSRKFAGLEVSSDRWGGIIRKLSFADKALQTTDSTFALVDGTAVDQYTVNKPAVLETRYVGSNVYEGCYTIFTKQLDVAFSSPEEFARFMSGLMTHFSNEREQWLEDTSRAIVMNMIAAKKDANNGLIHALTEYNAATGLSLTATTVRQPANFPAFAKWLYARVQNISELMTERSQKFQLAVTGYDINRHTPMEDQKIYMNADFLAHINAEVIADTYHDTFLRYADVEAVNFWQSIDSPLNVSAKPVYINASGAVTVASANVAVSPVLGIMFDRDAMGYNIYDDSLATSPYNAKGQYYNMFSHVRVQLQNDLTEKVVVIILD